ncbi:MAG: Type 1 glutamine amidotransferase-like domain-containing protein [Planctomycetota bacterium]|jgi:dipeptidase E
MKIIAIGGGKIGRFSPTVRTTAIDREIVRISGKKSPRLLFLPTASAGCDQYCAAIYRQFSRKLGCKVDIMLLVNTDPERARVRERILRADIIYVGEGNTLQMMKSWRRYGVDQALRAAMKRDIVLCGSSAGSIAWFSWGNSDSFKSPQEPNRLAKVKGLGFVDALICPHYDDEKHRRPSLKAMMKGHKGVAIALDEYCALVVQDDTYRVLASIKGRKAYRVFWENGEYVEEELIPSKQSKALEPLLKK